MKRKAILIGNTRDLNGVKVDVQRTKQFLESPVGGSWNSSEIETFINPQKRSLLHKLDGFRGQAYDYVFVLFSGHGGQIRQTVFELNGDEGTIPESTLHDIAKRQLTISDCCRVVSQPVMEARVLDSLSHNFSQYASTRKLFDERIMRAIPQQVKLYSCSVGQSSYDTPDGAIYLGNFLQAARSFEGSNSQFKTIESAHATAATNTTSQKSEQTPEAILPKCLTSDQLIISVRT